MMRGVWWWPVNTLVFNYGDCIDVTAFEKKIDGYMRDAGDIVAASRYLDYFLFYLAADMLTSVWCRRGEGFTVNHVTYLRKAHASTRQRMQDIPAIQLHGIDAMFRYNFHAVLDGIETGKLLKFSRLFTIQLQWYEREVAPTGQALEQILPELIMSVVSPHQPERFCTFKPWALYTGTGVVGFNNV